VYGSVFARKAGESVENDILSPPGLSVEHELEGPMLFEERDNDGVMLRLEAMIDLENAEIARDELLNAIRAATVPVRLEFTATPASAPALQLILAARLSLLASSAFAGFGPNAAALLSPDQINGSPQSGTPGRSTP